MRYYSINARALKSAILFHRMNENKQKAKIKLN